MASVHDETVVKAAREVTDAARKAFRTIEKASVILGLQEALAVVRNERLDGHLTYILPGFEGDIEDAAYSRAIRDIENALNARVTEEENALW